MSPRFPDAAQGLDMKETVSTLPRICPLALLFRFDILSLSKYNK
jgi:hypothetical protein